MLTLIGGCSFLLPKNKYILLILLVYYCYILLYIIYTVIYCISNRLTSSQHPLKLYISFSKPFCIILDKLYLCFSNSSHRASYTLIEVYVLYILVYYTLCYKNKTIIDEHDLALPCLLLLLHYTLFHSIPL